MLHNLKPANNFKSKKRIGRGGKRGTTSGKGQKGQKSRAGRRLRPAFRDLLLRIPKLRGFKNKPTTPAPKVFNLFNIQKIGLQIVSLNALKKAGILSKNYRGPVKILGGGEIKNKIEVRGLQVSESAKEKILKASGKVN